MPSDYTDYENNLAFAPTSADDLNEQKRESDVLVTALEKCQTLEAENSKLKSDLNNVLSLLIKVSPQHEEWIRVNYPEFYKEQANVWFE